MDTEKEDSRLAELREALSRLPSSAAGNQNRSHGVQDLHLGQLDFDFTYLQDLQHSQIPALSTDQIQDLTTISSVSPIYQTSILSGHTPDFHLDTNIEPTSTLKLQGKNADVIVNDVSLMDTLRQIQHRLNILEHNTELESEWQELRDLGDRYRALEKQILEKNALLETLKKMPKPEDFS